MKDIHDIIEEVSKLSGKDAEKVEKITRNLFKQIQNNMSKKEVYNVQIPKFGTFKFRANAIPRFIDCQKAIIAYWIGRIYYKSDKKGMRTIIAAKENISRSFHAVLTAAKIKKLFLEKHGKYKPKTVEYLTKDTESDLERISEYCDTLKAELFSKEHYKISEEDLQRGEIDQSLYF